MADGKVIRVSEKIHAKVAEIADSNYRGMGDQVAYWAEKECTHPLKDRIEVNIVVAPVVEPQNEKAAQVGKGQPFRGFYCARCRQYVLNGVVGDEIKAALRAPVLGKV